MSSRLPRAPEGPLPELAEFLAPLRVHFAQAPSARLLERYCTGLLTEIPNKNCDTMAQVLPGVNEQQLNHLVSELVWDETALNHARIRQRLAVRTERDAVLIVDDTGFPPAGSPAAVAAARAPHRGRVAPAGRPPHAHSTTTQSAHLSTPALTKQY